MVNQKEKIVEDYKNRANIFFALLCGFLLGFLFWKVTNKIDTVSQEITHKIVPLDKNNLHLRLKIDSLNYVKLENAVSLVETKNDGRFEVLTWSAALVLTILGAFLTLNFYISSAKVRETVDIEIDKKTEVLEKIRKDFEEKKQEVEQLLEDVNKEFEKIKDFTGKSEEILKRKPK